MHNAKLPQPPARAIIPSQRLSKVNHVAGAKLYPRLPVLKNASRAIKGSKSSGTAVLRPQSKVRYKSVGIKHKTSANTRTFRIIYVDLCNPDHMLHMDVRIFRWT